MTGSLHEQQPFRISVPLDSTTESSSSGSSCAVYSSHQPEAARVPVNLHPAGNREKTGYYNNHGAGRCPNCMHLVQDEDVDSRATAAEGDAVGTTNAVQPAADSATQAINPSFMTFGWSRGRAVRQLCG